MTAKSDIGFISERQAVLWLKAIAYTVAILLVVLSVLGNFYWLIHRDATIVLWSANPYRSAILRDIMSVPEMFGAALFMQFITSGIQFGSLVLARYYSRWWLLVWLAALAASSVPNCIAYTPILWPSLFLMSYPIIVLGDVIPEVISVIRQKQ